MQKHWEFQVGLTFRAFIWFWMRQRLCAKVYQYFWPRRELYFNYWVRLYMVCKFKRVFCCVCKTFTEKMWLGFSHFCAAFRPLMGQLLSAFSISLPLLMLLSMTNLLSLISSILLMFLRLYRLDFSQVKVFPNLRCCKVWVKYNSWYLRWIWVFCFGSKFSEYAL